MRDIKFRVWDKLTKQMLFEDFHLLGEVMAFSLIDQWVKEHKEGKGLLERYNDMVFQQYIGIKDTNQKDIYEGDVVEYDETDIGGFHGLGQVEYNTDICLTGAPNFGLWCYKLLSNKNLKESQNGIGWSSFPFNAKVVGNIFENPEIKN